MLCNRYEMKKLLLNFWLKHTELSIGIGVSISLLIIFLLFQFFNSDMLNLETRWLVVASAPLLVALLAGGYIKSFKGFGVELEASLSKPVVQISLSATEVMEHVKGSEKRSMNFLRNMSLSDRRKVSRLSLLQGKDDYYNEYVLKGYLHELIGLKYIEVKDQSGKFVALIPIAAFKRGKEVKSSLVHEFIAALENNEILQVYSSLAITDNVYENTDIIQTLLFMRKKNIKNVAVVDSNDTFVGLLPYTVIEKIIVDNVISAKDSA